MRILLAVHHFLPKYTGGAEGYAYRLARGLRARGHDVQVLCVEQIDHCAGEDLTWVDNRFDGIPVRRLSFDLSAAENRATWEYSNPWVGMHLREYIPQCRPDVFHLVSGYLLSGSALQAACDLKLPSMVTLTDYWFLCRRSTLLRTDGSLSTLPIEPARCAQCMGEERRRYRIPGRLAQPVMRAFWRRQDARIRELADRQHFLLETLKRADALVSPSRFLRSTYIRAGVRTDNFAVIPHGIDLARSTPAMLLKAKSTQLRIGYLGQIGWHKGVHVLVDAALRLPDPRLTVNLFGETSSFPEYVSKLKNNARGDPRILFAGTYQGQDELTKVLQELDVVVVPSICYENFPTVILEALAHRTPVIASNLGGMAEMVQHGQNGLLFRRGDSLDLAAQLQRLLSEPGLLESLRTRIAPVRSANEEVGEVEAMYAHVIDLRRSTPGG